MHVAGRIHTSSLLMEDIMVPGFTGGSQGILTVIRRLQVLHTDFIGPLASP